MFCSSLCCPWTCLFYCSQCCTCAWYRYKVPNNKVPNNKIPHNLSVYKSQCRTETCLSTRAFVCTWGVCQIYRACAALNRVCLQELLCAPEVSVDYIEPVLHLFLSVYKSFVQHLEVSVFKSLCCICAFLSPRALFCICACLQSTRVLCCTWTCLPTRVQCMLYLEEHSLQFFFLSVFSKQVCLFRLFR